MQQDNPNIRFIMSLGFFKALTKHSSVQQIILYGSRARNTAQERSDIDLAIVCPHASDKDWIMVLEDVDNADTLLTIDCVRYDQLSETNQLKQMIDQEGIIIFTRNPK